MKEADGEKAAKQALLDSTLSKRRSPGNSKAGRGLLLGLVTVAVILLCSSRLMFSFTALFTPRDPSTTRDSQVDARLPVFEHPQATAQFDEDQAALREKDESTNVGRGTPSTDVEDDSTIVGRGNASDVEDELEKLEAGDELQDGHHDAHESYDPEPGEERLDEDERKTTEEISLSDHANLNGDSEESAASEEDAAHTEEDSAHTEEDAAHTEDAAQTEEDAAQTEEDAAQTEEDAAHTEEDAAHTEEDAAHTEEDAAHTEEDAAHTEEDAAHTEEDAAHTEEDAAHTEEDAAHTEEDAAHTEEDAAHTEEDAAHTEEDAAHTEEDAAHTEEDAAHTEEDAAHTEEDAAPTDEDPVQAEKDAAAHAEDGAGAELEEVTSEKGDAGEKKVPDAIAYLARLAMKLTKMKTDVEEENGPYHNRRIFEMEYAEMKRSIKIFVYPFNSRDPFVNIYMPISRSPTGNYASEEFFQQALYRSGFVTKDAGKANFFFMPVSITKARLDKRINVAGLKAFCAKYVTGVRENYGHWNRSNGADHFYLSCHSIARSAMDVVPYVRENAIQLLCPSSYYLPNYITHKDAAVPQIWPRPNIAPRELTNLTQRTRLAFFAGSANSPVRQELVRVWGNDNKILIHKGKVPYPYSQGLMTSKFCLQAKGFEVNTARLGDAMFYGCVPVVIADYYDLPWQDILDWSKFSIVVTHQDIPLLKEILEAVSDEQYVELHKNVMLARKHFIWHSPAHDYDAFHTVMYELWKRRHIVRRSASP